MQYLLLNRCGRAQHNAATSAFRVAPEEFGPNFCSWGGKQTKSYYGAPIRNSPVTDAQQIFANSTPKSICIKDLGHLDTNPDPPWSEKTVAGRAQ